jgi:hypothetical protein
MAEITVTTDGTINGTKLMVDGKEITKKEKVVNISLYASAPYKSQYSGEIYKGGVSVDYTTMDDKGTVQSQRIGSSDSNYLKGIGQKIKQEDQVIRFIGEEIDASVSNMIDKIIKHCEDSKINCKPKEVLATRSVESLKDMAEDLGIKLED